MRPCATWLRSSAACSIPGSSTSSMISAWPVSSLRSSLRLTGSPRVRVDIGSAPDRFRRRHHGIDDVLVTGAAAQIARQRLADFCFGRRGVFVEKGRHGHEDAGRAVTALQAVMIMHRLLQRMIFAGVAGEAFDGRKFMMAGLYGQHQA